MPSAGRQCEGPQNALPGRGIGRIGVPENRFLKHNRMRLQVGQDRNAVGADQHQGAGARFCAGRGTSGRAADGLDLFRDMRQQVRLRFASKDEAVAYWEQHDIAYQVFEAKPVARRTISYSDNFAFNRRDAWTH